MNPTEKFLRFYRIKRNNLSKIELINAALSSQEGERVFFPDGTDGGSLVFDSNKEPTKIKAVRLSDYINEPVDFFKMNIEGAELDVLTEISDKLHFINEMVIEWLVIWQREKAYQKELSTA